MICTCGATIKTSEHKVKTIKRAKEWYEGSTLDLLPLNIETYACPSCGRFAYKVSDHSQNHLIRHNI